MLEKINSPEDVKKLKKEEKEKGLQIVAAIHNPCRRIN